MCRLFRGHKYGKWEEISKEKYDLYKDVYQYGVKKGKIELGKQYTIVQRTTCELCGFTKYNTQEVVC